MKNAIYVHIHHHPNSDIIDPRYHNMYFRQLHILKMNNNYSSKNSIGTRRGQNEMIVSRCRFLAICSIIRRIKIKKLSENKKT